jgi:hydrogenase nickel incorporation protein HypA/HybF
MHELAICQSILRQAQAVARAQRAERVISLTLSIGPLAGVEPALLNAAFPLAAAGTCCAGASLRIETVGVVVSCKICGAVSDALPNRLLCAVCGTWRVALRSGDEMRLTSLEVLDFETICEPECQNV